MHAWFYPGLLTRVCPPKDAIATSDEDGDGEFRRAKRKRGMENLSSSIIHSISNDFSRQCFPVKSNLF